MTFRPRPSQDAQPPAQRHADPLARSLGGGALLAAVAALVFAMTGSSPAAPDGRDGGGAPAATAAAAGRGAARRDGGRRRATRRGAGRRAPAATRPRPFGLVRLDARGKLPASVIPKVRASREADRVGGQAAEDLALHCPAETVDLGTWCLDSSTVALTPEEVGKNSYAWATRRCVERGGWLPTAGQLVGAADRVKLSGTIDDSQLTASIDESPEDGLKDQREMSSTLITTTAGSSAAGSQGVSTGARGNPSEGEPDPIPQPADPWPSSAQYITVYDNHDKGGLAGGKPVGQPERFRCAFAPEQGVPAGEQ